jgi:hypothetical protein
VQQSNSGFSEFSHCKWSWQNKKLEVCCMTVFLADFFYNHVSKSFKDFCRTFQCSKQYCLCELEPIRITLNLIKEPYVQWACSQNSVPSS